MKKNQMMKNVIRSYGMENEKAIEFCNDCNNLSKKDNLYIIERYYELMKDYE